MILKYLEKNKNITDFSGFKTQAKSKFFFNFNTLEDLDKLRKIFKFINNNKKKYLIIWWWTNLFFAFDTFDGVVIKNNFKWYHFNKNILDISTNETISDIAKILEKKHKNTIWHRFIWLPWSIWWAVFGNAWCFWLEIQNNFVSCRALNIHTWEIKNFNKKDICFRYRDSIFKKTWKYFIIDVKFDLSFKSEKYAQTTNNIDFRKYKQPEGLSCGSFFKNPKWYSAWKLIENVWLKWYKIWWAFFSPKHCNFLMSDGTATYQDLISLKDLAISRIKEKYDIILDSEVRIIYK